MIFYCKIVYIIKVVLVNGYAMKEVIEIFINLSMASLLSILCLKTKVLRHHMCIVNQTMLS